VIVFTYGVFAVPILSMLDASSTIYIAQMAQDSKFIVVLLSVLAAVAILDFLRRLFMFGRDV